MSDRVQQILTYWFDAADNAPVTLDALRRQAMLWFRRSADTDQACLRFGEDVERAAEGAYDAWSSSARGRLALVVLLDQFPRNIHRDSPRAFANDARALALALEGIERGVEAEYNEAHRLAFYLPLMHAESMALQRTSLEKYRALRDGAPVELRPELSVAFDFAQRHFDIIERFGRYPHRNATLGRASTPEELEFLKQPNSSF
jgi:uncharacterized protein (DUF924 family)